MSAYETNPSEPIKGIFCPDLSFLTCPIGWEFDRPLYGEDDDGWPGGFYIEYGILCYNNVFGSEEFYCPGYTSSGGSGGPGSSGGSVGSGDSGTEEDGTIKNPTNLVDACAGKKENSKCGWTGLSGTTHTGICVSDKKGKLYCDESILPPSTPNKL